MPAARSGTTSTARSSSSSRRRAAGRSSTTPARADAEPVTYRVALPYVVFVVATSGEHIDGLAAYFRTAPIASLDAPLLCSTLPNTSTTGTSAWVGPQGERR
ncbi:MAG: hypothetical protein U0838_04290 [Chloroflexota bacterium]